MTANINVKMMSYLIQIYHSLAVDVESLLINTQGVLIALAKTWTF